MKRSPGTAIAWALYFLMLGIGVGVSIAVAVTLPPGPAVHPFRAGIASIGCLALLGLSIHLFHKAVKKD